MSSMIVNFCLAWEHFVSNVFILLHWNWALNENKLPIFIGLCLHIFIFDFVQTRRTHTHTTLRIYHAFRVFSTWTTIALRIDHTHMRYSVIAPKNSVGKHITWEWIGAENHVRRWESLQTIATSLNHRCSPFLLTSFFTHSIFAWSFSVSLYVWPLSARSRCSW